tara:strand:+ start:194 stop:358 length:165 start_codon:yes stop_codon:yes gene_type:complete
VRHIFPETIVHFYYQLAESARNGTDFKINQVLQVRHAFPSGDYLIILQIAEEKT